MKTTPMDPLFLGIDVGTTSAKTVLADLSGATLWTTSAPYRYESPEPGSAEQNPEDWWDAVGIMVRELLSRSPEARHRIAAVGVSGQGVAAALLDDAGRPLRPAMLWLDVRCSGQAELLNHDSGDRIARISGKRPAAYNVEPKLLWLKENEPQIWKKTWKVMTTTAYVIFRLTRRPVMNYSDGGILLAYDLRNNCWSEELIELMGLPPSIYCDLAPCAQVIGEVTPEAAAFTGLAEGTPVIAGGEDTSSAGLAIGVTSSGAALLSLGSACTMYIPIVEPAVDPRLLSFPHVVENLTLIGGSMVGGGNAMDWIARALSPGAPSKDEASEILATLTREAAAVPAGAGSVVFLPYLAGELQPINDGFARGVFFGLSLSTRRGELVRAVMEGSAFAIRHNLAVAGSQGAKPERLVAVGGPTRNDVWCQIIADATRLPVQVMEENGGAPLGDAVLAAKGVGLITTYQSMVEAHSRRRRLFEPQHDASERYDQLFEVYTDLYPRLKDLFPRLAHPTGNLGQQA
ncbi:MAG TPA: FGGY family carbohydrate kinase [Terriglobia bacterium]|nr:FGGY family carbohydrate kinase [Terriglobia bacterium]